jgi:hypothetical protein
MTVIKFEDKSISKGELANELYKSEVMDFDCAIPQYWLDKIIKRFPEDQIESFGNLSGHFVYIYDNSDKSEYIMPLTKTGCKILGILSLYA